MIPFTPLQSWMSAYSKLTTATQMQTVLIQWDHLLASVTEIIITLATGKLALITVSIYCTQNCE